MQSVESSSSSGPGALARMSLDEVPVERLARVGPRVAERLARLGILSIQDLLFHLPNRYQDRTRLAAYGDLRAGEEVLVEGEVIAAGLSGGRRRSLQVWVALSEGPASVEHSAHTRLPGRGRSLSGEPLPGKPLPGEPVRHAGQAGFECGGEHSSGLILLRFFHFSRQQVGAFQPGLCVRCYGMLRQGPNALEMVHPEYRFQDPGTRQPIEQRLTPIYPSTEGLQQTSWRGLTDQALSMMTRQAPKECLPDEVLRSLGLPSLAASLQYLHRPPLDADCVDLTEGRHPAFQRLAFEELVAHQLSLRRMRAAHHAIAARALTGDGRLRRQLIASLPFRLTGAQARVVAEIADDLSASRPMQRLLQGDVGAGKTLVAALAALQAIESGAQVALMAPTELLSEQHRRGFMAWLAPLGVEPAWLVGRHKGRERVALLDSIASGRARMVMGTHALFQDDVAFRDLGLVIIDEQHRFGVHQRLRLREKGGRGSVPHQLIMTATPIPRSLAMTLYADLDLSVIDESPPGRTPIVTVAVPDSRRVEVIERVRVACKGGRQAYWVCTLIEESEVLECQAAEDTARELTAMLPELRVGLIHGRIKGPEREALMEAFAVGELDLLVATTVVEVGVDVPNASVMIIENPERLGLAQLHQLRGRVGRGAVQSHCVLLYHPPLSPVAQERLSIIRTATSGFEIAERDLAMRGAGEVLGTRQTGTVQFRVADPLRDQGLIGPAQAAADLILKRYPELVTPLITRWLGRCAEYAAV